MKKKKSPKYVTTGTYQSGGSNNLLWSTPPDINGNYPQNPGMVKPTPDPALLDAYTKFINDPRNKQLLDQYKKNGYSYSSDNNGANIKFERPTGVFDLSKGFQGANAGIDLITGIANKVGDLKDSRDQYKQYLQSIQPQEGANPYQDGKNDAPIFYGKGGMNKYQVGGLKSYNPNLASKDAPFLQWYNKNTLEGKNGIPFSDKIDYDYYSYFRNGDYKNYQGGHFPDTYKRPNHETFSNESIYSVPENPGGSWNGDQYIPNMKTGGINIKKSHRGLFTKEAKAAGMSVQEYASHVLANKDEYSTAVEKRAQFAHNFAATGGEVSPAKAKIILHDKEVKGHPLTDKQRRFFGYLSNKQVGGDNSQQPPIMAEAGEVYQNPQGSIAKIPDSMDDHDDASGGVQVNDAHRILEDTGDKRSDMPSQLLRLSPDMVKKLTGAKTNKTLTHSKAYEAGAKESDRLTKQTQNILQKNVDTIDRSPNDQYAKNSLELNFKRLDTIPTKGEIFDKLFDHQEAVKGKYNIANPPAEAKYGKMKKAQNGSQNRQFAQQFADGLAQVTGDTTLSNLPPDANVNMPNRVAQLPVQPQFQTPANGDINAADYNGQGNTEGTTQRFGDKTYQFHKGVWNDITPYTQNQYPQFTGKDVNIEDYYGNGNKEGATQQFGPDNYTFTNGHWDTTIPMVDLGHLQPDGTNLNLRTVPGKFSMTTSNPGLSTDIPDYGSNLHPTRSNGATANIPQSSSPFNAPLHWYDVATPIAAFTDALRRRSVKYNGIQLTAPQAKYVNPLPQLQQGQESYNAVLDNLPANGVGYANAANLFTRKYSMDNNILANTNNINNGIWNNNEQARVNTKNAQSQSDAQSRQTFDSQVAGGIEAQRQQLLRSMGDLTTTIAQNAKYNREGNLLMKLFPNFNQQGNYNGNKYNFQSPVANAATPQSKIDAIEKQGIKLSPSQKLAILTGTS